MSKAVVTLSGKDTEAGSHCNKDCQCQASYRVIEGSRMEASSRENTSQCKQKGQAVSDFVLPDLTYSFASVSSLNEDLEAILHNMKYL